MFDTHISNISHQRGTYTNCPIQIIIKHKLFIFLRLHYTIKTTNFNVVKLNLTKIINVKSEKPIKTKKYSIYVKIM